MAKEIKFIAVDPSDTEDTIELRQKFGWELVGTPQEIFSQTSGTSHLEKWGDRIRSVMTSGTKTHYVRITLRRDTSMKNYEQLCALEKEFYNINTSGHFSISSPTKKHGGRGGIIIAAIGTMLIIDSLSIGMGTVNWLLYVGVVTLLLGIVIKIIRGKSCAEKYDREYAQYNQSKLSWESSMSRLKARKREILELASLLQQ